MAEAKKDLDAVPMHLEQTHDDVFGEITDDGPNFRNVNLLRLMESMDG